MSVHANYLRDLGYLIREAGEQASSEAQTASPADRDFKAGQVLAFVAVASLMQQQAEAFGLPLVDIALEGLDPERAWLA